MTPSIEKSEESGSQSSCCFTTPGEKGMQRAGRNILAWNRRFEGADCNREEKGEVMRNLGFWTMLSAAVGCALLLISPQRASADTVTLTSVNYGPDSGKGTGQGNIYPYGFTIQSGTTSTTASLMCISYESDIESGETWKANVISAAGNPLYEQAAYIFSEMGANGAVDTQWAEWELLASTWDGADPTDYSLLSGEIQSLGIGNSVDGILSGAATWVADNPDSSLYSQYLIYVPEDGTQVPYSDGTPQILIGTAPEPSGLILLGSGLFFLALLMYRRKQKNAA
ncbi:MAG: PEP-CTERM sorting domain-containing protein [Terracidiphilus sp.]